jgi:hypothetical protein
VAAFLLTAADAVGLKVGSDGVDVVTVAPSPVPFELGRWLHAQLCEHKAAVIDIIERENAARTRASS